MTLDLRSLIARLGSTARRALDQGAALCASRAHREVDLEHWLICLLSDADADLPRILCHFGIPIDRLLRDLHRGLDGLHVGNGGRPELSPAIEQVLREAWMRASIEHEHERVRSGLLLLAALADPRLGRRLVDRHAELRRIPLAVLQEQLLAIVAGSREDGEVCRAHGVRGESLRDAASPARAAQGVAALDRYTVDLTAAARAGAIDPVRGRDREIRQIVDVLLRRRQNNPILTGEAGVGKTSVVEGFALRIAAGDVPAPLQRVVLRALDLGLLQAGAGLKGEFESRLTQVIEEVQSSPAPVVLFIDEAHALIGAGAAQGQSDAANLLKPALARGHLRTIAATTWAEYRKYVERDGALSRRFQVIKVEEPEPDCAVEMMRGLLGALEQHHGVRILDEAVLAAVRLSSRYIPARQLPDKSVSVLDTACARVAIGQQATPSAVEDLRRSIEDLERSQAILQRESAIGFDHGDRLGELLARLHPLREQLHALETRWEQERQLVARILELQRRLGAEGGGALQDGDRLREHHEACRAELRALQGGRPLVQAEVDGEAVAAVVSSWTGIPAGAMVADELQTVLGLPERLADRVIGQDHALRAIGRRIRTARARLDHPSRPVAVFLLAGPSGVGKTETALALADALYGGERGCVALRMSEYQEAHSVSGLKGSPPGYVGYGESGVLTESVRRRPHCVVLLDEVDRAHPDVLELFFQVFDQGVLEDGEGREIDFRHAVILLTSNLGAARIEALCADPAARPEPDVLAQAIRPQLLEHFPAALLARLVVVPYYPIAPGMLRKIARLQLERIEARVREGHRARMVWTDAVLEAVVSRCSATGSGARSVDAILAQSLLPQIASRILTRVAAGQRFACVNVDADAGGELCVELG